MLSYDAIATALVCGVPWPTTISIIKTEDRPRKGRPRVASAKADKAMARMALRSKKASARKIANQVRTTHGGAPGHSTVHARLCEQGIHWASMAKRPALTDTQKATRLTSARDHFGCYWSAVVFADEANVKPLTRSKKRWPARMSGHHARQSGMRRPSTWPVMVASDVSGASHRTLPEP